MIDYQGPQNISINGLNLMTYTTSREPINTIQIKSNSAVCNPNDG